MKRTELVEQYLNGSQTLQRLWKAYFHGLLESEGLSHAQISTLFFISSKQPVSSKDLAGHMQISRSAVAQLLDALDRQGHVIRKADPSDRRISYISLSEVGEKRLAMLHEKRDAIHKKFAAALADDELDFMITIQKKMTNELEQEVGKNEKKGV